MDIETQQAEDLDSIKAFGGTLPWALSSDNIPQGSVLFNDFSEQFHIQKAHLSDLHVTQSWIS